jgi:hypothetical protein
MSNHVQAFHEAVDKGDEQAANRAYEAYVNNMKAHNQKPKARKDL